MPIAPLSDQHAAPPHHGIFRWCVRRKLTGDTPLLSAWPVAGGRRLRHHGAGAAVGPGLWPGFSVFQIGFAFFGGRPEHGGYRCTARIAQSSPNLSSSVLLDWLAVVGPLFSHMLTNWSGQWMTPFLVIGILFALLRPHAAAVRVPGPQPVRSNDKRSVWQSMRILLTPVVLFLRLDRQSLYVGSEQGISVWMYTYLVKHHNAADLFWRCA